MATKKDLIIAVLATFCLTSALFMVIPTKGSSNSLPYDPWVDLNGDGTIDIYDITFACELYDTSGDPTRAVTIKNHTTYEWTGWKTIPAGGDWTVTNKTLGYSKTTVIVQVFPGGSYVTMNVQWFINGAAGLTGYNFDVIDLRTPSPQGNWGKIYDVPGSELHVVLHNFESVSVDVRVGIYMTV